MSIPSSLHSPETEIKVLSVAIQDQNSLMTVVQNLYVSDFFNEINQEIFNLLVDVYKETESVSLHFVCEKAKDKNILEKVGGLQSLIRILTTISYSSEVISYIEIIKSKSSKRELFNFLKNINEELVNDSQTLEQSLESIRDKLYKIECRSSNTEFVSLNEIMDKGVRGQSVVESIQEVQNTCRDNPFAGLATGFKNLDNAIGGLQKGNLILLAARPGMGKTTLAINIFEHLTIEKKIPCLFIPLEMSPQDVMEKIISSQCSIEYKKLRESTISSKQFQDIVVFMKEQYHAYITSRSHFNIGTLRAAAIRAKDALGVQAIIVDYLQLLHGSEKARSENKYQEISEISMSLKRLAREIDLPIICLSQLSRKVEERQNQLPILSDLRDSGSLEADADIVLFLYRYDHKDQNYRPGDSVLTVAKNRRGCTGDIQMTHRLEYSSFSEKNANRQC